MWAGNGANTAVHEQVQSHSQTMWAGNEANTAVHEQVQAPPLQNIKLQIVKAGWTWHLFSHEHVINIISKGPEQKDDVLHFVQLTIHYDFDMRNDTQLSVFTVATFVFQIYYVLWVFFIVKLQVECVQKDPAYLLAIVPAE